MADSHRRTANWTDELYPSERAVLQLIRHSRPRFVLLVSALIAVITTTVTLITFTKFGVGPNETAWRIGAWISIVLPMIFGPVLLNTIARLVSLLDWVGEEFQSLAHRDPLTSALNRRGLRDSFEEGNFPSDASVVVIDINRFKQINDAHGHEFGDQTLVHIARWLTRAAGPGSLVARLGGDEFAAVAAPGVEIDRNPDLELGDIPISISVGVSRLGSDLQEALREADEQLYEVKRNLSDYDTDGRLVTHR